MTSSAFHPSLPVPHLSTSELARRAGLSWVTVRNALRGQGTIASLAAVVGQAGWRWSWSLGRSPAALGGDLAGRRKVKGISQRDMAARLSVTQSTIVNLETKFRGRIPTLFAYLRVLGVHEPILADARLRRLIPPTNPDEADRVYTPRALAVAIVDSFRLELSGTLLDPARGQGAFYDAFPAHLARDWCEIDAGRDFFAWSQPVDWIITNPPFGRFRDFLIHGMAVASNVLFLAPLTHFTTRHRVSAIREAGFAVRRILLVPTPIDWPSSGFQMAAVHLQRGWAGSTKIGALPG